MIKETAKYASLILQAETAQSFHQYIFYLMQAVFHWQRIRNITKTPAKVLRTTGKIDMRRYRRYLMKKKQYKRLTVVHG